MSTFTTTQQLVATISNKEKQMAITTTVYKVVRPEDGSLWSKMALGKYRTKYPPGEWVGRNNLFVFINLSDAREAAMHWEEVWECETTSDPRPAPEFVPHYYYTYTGDEGYRGAQQDEADKLIKEFWDSPYSKDEGRLWLLVGSWGAHLVDDIKLIRKVA